MAERAEKKAESPAPSPASSPQAKKDAAGKAGLLTSTPIIIAGVMLLEAAVLFVGFKFLGASGPQAAAGADLTVAETSEAGESSHGQEGEKAEGGHGEQAGGKVVGNPKRPVEIPVVEFRAPNKQSGRTFLYDVSIYLVTKAQHQAKIEDKLKEHAARIKDRVRTIIAQSDPEKLGGGSEPGLETLRRQVKYQLDEIMGEGLVEEVLVPKCTPYRADY